MISWWYFKWQIFQKSWCIYHIKKVQPILTPNLEKKVHSYWQNFSLSLSEHKSQLIPNSIICTKLDTKPYKSIPEWPDDSQHVFHHLSGWRQGQEESGWFRQKYQQCVCIGEPIILYFSSEFLRKRNTLLCNYAKL